MIIHRIHANNVLKYTSLRLDDLPERGLIAITGPNESGKSTIGETLCFALFGRTFSLDYDDLGKVIHWGETHCSVEVEFTASDGDRYTLERFLDDSGNHSARISKVDQSKDAGPLARGIDKVADLVYELIGYEYEEFIESFYLAQREITTPHPHSYAVKTMAGLVTLEYSATAFQEEVEETGKTGLPARAGERAGRAHDATGQVQPAIVAAGPCLHRLPGCPAETGKCLEGADPGRIFSFHQFTAGPSRRWRLGIAEQVARARVCRGLKQSFNHQHPDLAGRTDPLAALWGDRFYPVVRAVLDARHKPEQPGQTVGEDRQGSLIGAG
jgi:hypothetical protein